MGFGRGGGGVGGERGVWGGGVGVGMGGVGLETIVNNILLLKLMKGEVSASRCRPGGEEAILPAVMPGRGGRPGCCCSDRPAVVVALVRAIVEKMKKIKLLGEEAILPAVMPGRGDRPGCCCCCCCSERPVRGRGGLETIANKYLLLGIEEGWGFCLKVQAGGGGGHFACGHAGARGQARLLLLLLREACGWGLWS